MNTNYAMLPDRIKASINDALLIIAAMYAVSELLLFFNEVPNYIRMVIAVLLFILYDPFFTSRFRGTIGHSYSNITVRKDVDRKRFISFPSALIRVVLKFSLGWVSLLTVTGNEKKKAVHDFIAKSVVLNDQKSI